jgi:3-methylcrotonyl-CoA carboxylase alpha subunit
MFNKILIANRGEIACRVISTAKRLGIQTVAVYSDADANAPHVRMADQAFRLGPAAARDSYLRADLILEIAKKTGAQAVHPGYGFLSENEQFANDCAANGVVFIGPPASAIAAMGSKSAAKSLMEKAGVPLVPGYHGDRQEPEFLQAQAVQMGFPVLIKASAGGGGKGMRIVTSAAEFAAALASCQREAKSSFGDDHVLIERYLAKPRHIEVQVFADTQGDCVYLFERDCSVQRRHQKVIEEAPAPGMTDARRKQMGEAAVAAAKAVGYVGAGTVEFITEPSGVFYFMEMNTRLQVEHPVTEMICGLDLVEWQLRAAAGEPLPLTQDQLRIDGHSIEARIYAENPSKGFLPATGPIDLLQQPDAVRFTTGQTAHPLGQRMQGNPASVRIDSGIQAGGEISPFYDPMIAKLIVWGPDRKSAIARMQAALQQFEVAPLVTNCEFLQRLMQCPSFTNADLDTGLIEREREFLFAPSTTVIERQICLATAAMLAQEQEQSRSAEVTSGDPWDSANGFRLYTPLTRDIALEHNEQRYKVSISYAKQGFTLSVNGGELHCLSAPRLITNSTAKTTAESNSITEAKPVGKTLHCILGSQTIQASVLETANHWIVFSNGAPLSFKKIPELSWVNKAAAAGGSVTAAMPGKIVALLAEAGANIQQGQALLVMEAMKMEHTLTAPSDGTLEEFLFRVGDQVTDGAILLRMTASK